MTPTWTFGDRLRNGVTGRAVIDDGIGSRIWHLELVGSRKARCGMRIMVPRIRGFAEPYPAIERPCRRCAATPEWRSLLALAHAEASALDSVTGR